VREGRLWCVLCAVVADPIARVASRSTSNRCRSARRSCRRR
jgi:hypothetical protein